MFIFYILLSLTLINPPPSLQIRGILIPNRENESFTHIQRAHRACEPMYAAVDRDVVVHESKREAATDDGDGVVHAVCGGRGCAWEEDDGGGEGHPGHGDDGDRVALRCVASLKQKQKQNM